jgi:VanZ family protein
LTIYGLLALAVMWGFGPGREGAFVKVAVETVLFCLVYGMTDEFHQSFIPRRSVSGLDLLADLAGVMLVCGIWLMNGNFLFLLNHCRQPLPSVWKEIILKLNIRMSLLSFQQEV